MLSPLFHMENKKNGSENLINHEYYNKDIHDTLLRIDEKNALEHYKELGLIPTCPQCGKVIDGVPAGSQIVEPCGECRLNGKCDHETENKGLPPIDAKIEVKNDDLSKDKYIVPED